MKASMKPVFAALQKNIHIAITKDPKMVLDILQLAEESLDLVAQETKRLGEGEDAREWQKVANRVGRCQTEILDMFE